MLSCPCEQCTPLSSRFQVQMEVEGPLSSDCSPRRDGVQTGHGELRQYRVTDQDPAAYPHPNDGFGFARQIASLKDAPKLCGRADQKGRQWTKVELAWTHQERQLRESIQGLRVVRKRVWILLAKQARDAAGGCGKGGAEASTRGSGASQRHLGHA